MNKWRQTQNTGWEEKVMKSQRQAYLPANSQAHICQFITKQL